MRSADLEPGMLERAFFAGLRRVFPTRELEAAPRKMLVVHAGGLGDLLMATPALRALRRRFPQCTIHFLGYPSLVEVFSGLSHFDKIIPSFDHTKLRHPFLSGHFREWPRLLSVLAALRREKYDTMLLLQPQMSAGGAIRLAALSLGLGIPNLVGRDTEGRGFFLTKRIPERFFEPKHEVERVIDVVRAIGVSPDGRGLEVAIPKEAQRVALELLQTEGIGHQDSIVAFSPGSRKNSRKWDIERWAELGDRLSDKFGAKIVVVGGADETALAREIANLMGIRPSLLVGRTSLLGLAAVLDLSRVVVSVDSGPMHLASALSPALVALFGPGQFDRIRPYGEGKRWAIVRQEADCAPCYRDYCPDNKCMKAISVEAVFEAVASVW